MAGPDRPRWVNSSASAKAGRAAARDDRQRDAGERAHQVERRAREGERHEAGRGSTTVPGRSGVRAS